MGLRVLGWGVTAGVGCRGWGRVDREREECFQLVSSSRKADRGSVLSAGGVIAAYPFLLFTCFSSYGRAPVDLAPFSFHLSAVHLSAVTRCRLWRFLSEESQFRAPSHAHSCVLGAVSREESLPLNIPRIISLPELGTTLTLSLDGLGFPC